MFEEKTIQWGDFILAIKAPQTKPLFIYFSIHGTPLQNTKPPGERPLNEIKFKPPFRSNHYMIKHLYPPFTTTTLKDLASSLHSYLLIHVIHYVIEKHHAGEALD